jgi:putative Holliday junction resolvase
MPEFSPSIGFKPCLIAITDELQIIASGLTTIPSETAIAFLKDYFSKEKVGGAYCEPKQMNGEPVKAPGIEICKTFK